MTRLLSPILADYGDSVAFRCPGCGDTHVVRVKPGAGACWGYNGNPDAPTFTPSLLVRSGHHVPGHEGESCWCTWEDRDEFPELKCYICHSHVTDGRIQFLGDCTHELAGQTVPLPEWAA